MVTILANLSIRCDDSDLNEQFFFKKTMVSFYWKNFEKAMHAKFWSFTQNDTYEYSNTPSNSAVLMSYWIFKIKKDRWDKILKFQAQRVVYR